MEKVFSKIFQNEAFRYVFANAFTPIRLFSDGQSGSIWPMYNSDALFSTNTGTTLASINGLVGRINDTRSNAQLGSELVTNGTFSVDANWTKGAGWSIGSGVASKIAGSNGSLIQDLAITAGKTYQVVYTLTLSAGGFVTSLGNTSTGVKLSSGTYTELIVAGSANMQISFFGNNVFIGSVDNVSIKEVVGSHLAQATSTLQGTLRSINNNRVVRLDLLDDAYTTVFPAGITGQILVAGIGGQKVTNVTISSGGTFTFGPTTWTGGAVGDMTAVHGSSGSGGIVGAVLRQGNFTDTEKSQLVQFMKQRGAGNLL